jgi:hypothetical protein
MNCSEFEEIVHEVDRPGTAGFAAREAAFAHADSCDRCTELLTQSEALDFTLNAISQKATHERAPARIEAALLNEFRRRNAPSSRSLQSRYIAALGAAAAALLAISLAFHHRIEKRDVTARFSGVSAPRPAAAEHVGEIAPAQSAGSGEQLAENQTPESDSETPFLPLPYADDAMASEGGTVVRVILSRPALASLGVPVTDIGSGDRIPADIVMSEDGAPQAIRLVADSDLE